MGGDARIFGPEDLQKVFPGFGSPIYYLANAATHFAIGHLDNSNRNACDSAWKHLRDYWQRFLNLKQNLHLKDVRSSFDGQPHPIIHMCGKKGFSASFRFDPESKLFLPFMLCQGGDYTSRELKGDTFGALVVVIKQDDLDVYSMDIHPDLENQTIGIDYRQGQFAPTHFCEMDDSGGAVYGFRNVKDPSQCLVACARPFALTELLLVAQELESRSLVTPFAQEDVVNHFVRVVKN